MEKMYERNRLVEENMGLVYMVAKKFCGRGVEFEDLVQIGSVGLIKAAERFDLEYNVQFSTYAVTIIIGEIKRYLRDDGILKIPRSIKETGVRILKTADRMKKELDREPTITEISAELGINCEKVVEAIEAMRPCESLYCSDEKKQELSEVIADDNEGALHIEDKIFLKEMLANLDLKLRQVVFLRYFKDKTQSEIGRILKISQVQVSRLEKKALEIMRNKSKTVI